MDPSVDNKIFQNVIIGCFEWLKKTAFLGCLTCQSWSAGGGKQLCQTDSQILRQSMYKQVVQLQPDGYKLSVLLIFYT